MAMVPERSGKGQNRAIVYGGQMDQKGRSRMVEVVEMSLFLVEFQPGPGSSVGRAAAVCLSPRFDS